MYVDDMQKMRESGVPHTHTFGLETALVFQTRPVSVWLHVVLV